MKVPFPIVLPAILLASLQQDAEDLTENQFCNEAPSYEEFVNELFNHMNNRAECLQHATIGLAGEGGEILDCSKREWIYKKELDVENLIEELGDIRFYYQQILNMTGLTDADIVASNVKKLKKRYPSGRYTNFDATNRADKE